MNYCMCLWIKYILEEKNHLDLTNNKKLNCFLYRNNKCYTFDKTLQLKLRNSTFALDKIRNNFNALST